MFLPVPLLDIFHGIALSLCDSIQSKLFESEELGIIFKLKSKKKLISDSITVDFFSKKFQLLLCLSILGRVFSLRTMLNIFLLFSIPAYNILFKSTMDEMPGAFFLLSVPINLIVCILYGYVVHKSIH